MTPEEKFYREHYQLLRSEIPKLGSGDLSTIGLMKEWGKEIVRESTKELQSEITQLKEELIQKTKDSQMWAAKSMEKHTQYLELKAKLDAVDEELMFMEDYTHGGIGETITKLRHLIIK